MKRIVKKFLIMIVTLLAVSFLVFLALSIIPGDAATNMLGTQATPEKIEALREEMGLDDPFYVQYFRWLFGCLKGDFGTSYSYHMSVSSLIMDKLPITITLTLFSFIIIFVVSIPYLSAFVFIVVRASFTSFNAVRNVFIVLSLSRSALMFEHLGIQTL